MPTYKTRAICLKNTPLGEADKLVTLFTYRHGKIRAKAPGAARVPSRLGGVVQTFTYGDFLLAKGRTIDIIAQCEVRETFQPIRENPKFLKSGFYFIKLADLATVEGQPNPELFKLLLKYLAILLFPKLDISSDRIEKNFEIELMKVEVIYKEKVLPKLHLSEHLGEDLRLCS